jgi:hypothetical protein
LDKLYDMADAPQPSGIGGFAGFWLIVGGAMLLVSTCSAVNTIFQWDMHLEGVELPKDWDGVAALTFISIMIILLSLLGSLMAGIVKDGSFAWYFRLGALLVWPCTVATIVLTVWYLTVLHDYGSLFVYDCAKEASLEDIQAQLDEGVSARELDECLWHSAQDERVDLLEPLFAAGANFEAKHRDIEDGYCAVNAGRSLPYIRKAVELGATPDNCPRSEYIILWMAHRSWDRDDASTAEAIEILMEAGWDPDAMPPDATSSALERFEADGFEACVGVLEAAGATRTRKDAARP